MDEPVRFGSQGSGRRRVRGGAGISISFRILPSRGLVFVRYEGEVRFADTERAVAAYAADPEARPGQNQLVDLAGVTDWERDFPRLMRTQTAKAGVFLGARHDLLIVYHAPTVQTRELARFVLRSWDGVPGVIPLIQETEADALNVLGQPETSFAALPLCP